MYNTNLTRRNKIAVVLVTLLTIVIALNFKETQSITAEANTMSAMSNQSNTMVNERQVGFVEESVADTLFPHLASVVATYEQKEATPEASVSKNKETTVTKVTTPPTKEKKKVTVYKTYSVTAEFLNVRTNPYYGSKVKDVLRKGDTIVLSGKTKGDWVQLKQGGYVHSKYTTMNPKPAAQISTKTTAKAPEVKVIKTSAKTTTAKPAKLTPKKTVAKTSAPSGPIVSPVTAGINSRSNLTVDDVELILKTTQMGGRATAQAIIDIEEKHGVNALFTIAVGKLESGNGKSRLARNKNNLFGLNATGDVYNNANSYKSKAASVYDFGKIIERGYINKGLTSISAVNKKYCPPNPDWKNLVGSIVRGDIRKI